MASITEKQDESYVFKHPVLMVAQVYGPYAFGMCSLLLIWFTIVQPELMRSKIDYETQLEIVDQLQAQNLTQAEVGRSLERTAIIMSSVLDRLHSLDGDTGRLQAK